MFNPNSGTALKLGLAADAISKLFDGADLNATVDADDSVALDQRIKGALATDADVIVAAGGDGTITALASAMVGSAKTLALLPLGTANLLARDLKIPLELDAAVAALSSMEAMSIDVAQVNGRVFLHNVTLGFVAGVAVGREQIRGRTDLAAKVGFFRYFLRRVARAKRIAVEITASDLPPRIVRAHAISVANNLYDQGFGQVFSRKRLDGGRLGVYTLKHLVLSDVIRLSVAMLLGRWQEQEAVDIEDHEESTIRSKRPAVMAMLDGEIETLSMPLRFKILPKSLSVLVPRQEPDRAIPEV